MEDVANVLLSLAGMLGSSKGDNERLALLESMEHVIAVARMRIQDGADAPGASIYEKFHQADSSKE